MFVDLQKPSLWKRTIAHIFDLILLVCLVMGLMYLLASVLGYDQHSAAYEQALEHYEAEYGISFTVTEEEYAAMTEEERAQWEKAYNALIADEEAMHHYSMIINLILLNTSLSILIAFLLLDFAVPLLFGNGQTLGKKIFSVGVVRTDSVKVSALQLFIRTVLGKFTIETMLPVYLAIMIFFNGIGIMGTILLFVILGAEILTPLINRDNRALHDLLAGTVSVDISSQRVFRTTQDLMNYKNSRHAEEVARKSY